MCLSDSFFSPVALPIFLRGIDPNIIGAVGYGDLMFRVFLYVDWDAFSAIVAKEGGTFSWSSEKDARRARSRNPTLRPTVIGGRLANIEMGGVQLAITDPMRVQLLFDGLRPRVIAKQAIELASRYGTSHE